MKNWRQGDGATYAQLKLDGLRVVVDELDGARFRKTAAEIPGHLKWKLPRGVRVAAELWVPGRRASYVKTALREDREALRLDAFAVETMSADTTLESVTIILADWDIPYIPWTRRDVNLVLPLPHYRGAEAEGYVFKDGNWLNERKWKPVRTMELVVVDVTDGNGKYLGLIGSLVCALHDGRVVANAGGMSDATRIEMSLNSPIGRVVEVRYDYVGDGGRLRFPRFVRYRDDKEPRDCTKDQDDDL